MTPSELTARVTLTTALAMLPLALAGFWLGGAPGMLGTAAGATLALGSFRLLAARVSAMEGTPAAGWLLASALRFAGIIAVAVMLLVTGWAHPLALVAGYSVLPVAVVLQGLRAAREEIS